MKNFFLSVLLCMTAFPVAAQELSLSTNIVDYANGGAANLEAAYGFTRHWSMNAGMKYDAFGTARQQLYSLGSRYWPWHIYSGWWFGGKMQYQEFNEKESWGQHTSEGDRYGAGLSGGYSRMLSKHLNVDLGLGLWAGYTSYVTYACPTCGRRIDAGSKAFILPNDIMIALSYIF
jgi:hypothetical protein